MARLYPMVPLATVLAVLPAGAQTRDWSVADRTIIANFTRITSVAAATDRVFVTAPSGLLIWNPQFRQWTGPYAPPQANLLERVFAALVDPLDNSVWMARTDGWVHFNPAIQLWESGLVPGSIQDLAFDLDNPTSGLYLRASGRWLLVPRGGIAAMPSPPPVRPLRPTTIRDAIEANPALSANSASILLNNRLRTARYTAAAQGFAGQGWYLGTWGLGLLHLQDGAALPERLTFGLPGDMVGALFSAPGGVWASTDRTALDDAALTFVASDLSEFRWIQGGRATGFPFSQVRKLVGQGPDLWAATDQGVARFTGTEGEVKFIDQARGLPDNRVLALASRRGRIAIGTARGVVRLDDSLQVQPYAAAFHDPAYAVQLSGDTIWVGTRLGLFAALPDQPDLIAPEGLSGSPAYKSPVVAISWLGDTLVALTEDRMLWRVPGSGTWSLGPELSALLGRLRALVPWRDGFYLAGQRGVAFARLNSPPIRPLFTPGDLPGEVFDLAVDPDFLWVATGAGLVRWRLDAIRP